MNASSQNLVETTWTQLTAAARERLASNPDLSALWRGVFDGSASLAEGLARLLTRQTVDRFVTGERLADTFRAAFEQEPQIVLAAATDLNAVIERDPAAKDMLTPFLYFKGFHALQTHRVAHWLWQSGRADVALFLQNRSSVLYGVDIHPAARIGAGIMIDHATGLVIGETAVVEDNVSMLHGVTLGGTGKEQGDRHPKVRRGVMIGAGAKILGNVEIGEGACIAAGSVVLENVPAHTTAAGVPAKIVGKPRSETPATEMDQRIPEVS